MCVNRTDSPCISSARSGTRPDKWLERAGGTYVHYLPGIPFAGCSTPCQKADAAPGLKRPESAASEARRRTAPSRGIVFGELHFFFCGWLFFMASGPPRPLTTNETRSLPVCGVRVRPRSPRIAKVSGRPHFQFAVDIAANKTLRFLAAHFSTPLFTDRSNASFSRSRALAKRDIAVPPGIPDRKTTCLHQDSKQAFLPALVYNVPRPN